MGKTTKYAFVVLLYRRHLGFQQSFCYPRIVILNMNQTIAIKQSNQMIINLSYEDIALILMIDIIRRSLIRSFRTFHCYLFIYLFQGGMCLPFFPSVFFCQGQAINLYFFLLFSTASNLFEFVRGHLSYPKKRNNGPKNGKRTSRSQAS